MTDVEPSYGTGKTSLERPIAEPVGTAQPIFWTEANQSYLVLEFSRLRLKFNPNTADSAETTLNESIEQIRTSLNPPPAIDRLTEIFQLSRFEREILLLCAGIEMDSTLAAQCSEALGSSRRSSINFSLCLALLAEPHWSALAPAAPLRRYRLLEMETGCGLTSAPLRIDERILHYLAGVNLLDSRLGLLLQAKAHPVWIADEHQALSQEILRTLAGNSPQTYAVQLYGNDPEGQEDIAVLLAENANRQLYVLQIDNLPASAAELEQLLELWNREAAVLPAALLLQCGATPLGPLARQLIDRLPVPVFIASRDPLRLQRNACRFEINKPLATGQKRLWKRALGPVADNLDGLLDDLAEEFRLSAARIANVGASAVADGQLDAERLWNTCRALSRSRLEDLAERILPAAGWDDLVLPDAQKQILQQLSAQMRNRLKVYETWGFSAKGSRGLGISALFAGPSGTGKTLAAEVLAAELKLDLYRIDLSAVVSKYIGETEKNLKQVFDAAEEGGVLLLFDEADALFGKRGEVKDSHDRYANIEVGYLLQRMESFQGLAILTTNLKSTLDKAFQRCIRFSVDFPFPDATQREAIWQRIMPAQTPTEGLQPKLLAQLNMTGGNIRNIALNAAFLAAEAGSTVGMAHLLQATKLEALKIERPLSGAETRGWV